MSNLNHEIGSDIPPRDAEVEPPTPCSVVPASGSADPIMGVTSNALLLLGMIAGAMIEHGYHPIAVDAADGSQILKATETGNTFRISVVQLEGTE